MKNKLRVPKNLKKDKNYLYKEKKYLKLIFKILFTLVIIIVFVNFIRYMQIISSP